MVVPKHKMRRITILHAGGLVTILEEMEARRREAQGNDVHKLQAAAQRARKAQKASRDKKTGRKDAEDALHEDTAGKKAWVSSIKYTSLTSKFGHNQGQTPVTLVLLVESLVLGVCFLFEVYCCICLGSFAVLWWLHYNWNSVAMC